MKRGISNRRVRVGAAIGLALTLSTIVIVPAVVCTQKKYLSSVTFEFTPLPAPTASITPSQFMHFYDSHTEIGIEEHGIIELDGFVIGIMAPKSAEKPLPGLTYAFADDKKHLMVYFDTPLIGRGGFRIPTAKLYF